MYALPYRPLMTLVGALAVAAAALTALIGCGGASSDAEFEGQRHSSTATPNQSESSHAVGKVGVLLVSHGSHSDQWREMLLDLHLSVDDALLAMPGIEGVKSAFMEYTEPSIATQLEAFDAEGYDQVILVPILLTVSSHSFDDIPTIYGAKQDAVSIATLASEGIARYTPEAEVAMTPLIDFGLLMQANLARRVKALSEDPAHERVVVVAYGSEPYDEEWHDFFGTLDAYLEENLGIAGSTHCWCGHIARYSPQPTIDAIQAGLAESDSVIVIPALVAVDEYFQNEIIGKAVEAIPQADRVRYQGDAILPDPVLDQWIVEIVGQTLDGLGAPDGQAAHTHDAAPSQAGIAGASR